MSLLFTRLSLTAYWYVLECSLSCFEFTVSCSSVPAITFASVAILFTPRFEFVAISLDCSMKSVPSYRSSTIVHALIAPSCKSFPSTDLIAFAHNESISIVHAPVFATSASKEILIHFVYAHSVGVIVTSYQSSVSDDAQAYNALPF